MVETSEVCLMVVVITSSIRIHYVGHGHRVGKTPAHAYYTYDCEPEGTRSEESSRNQVMESLLATVGILAMIGCSLSADTSSTCFQSNMLLMKTFPNY